MRAWRDRLGKRGPKIGLFWRSTSASSAFHTRRSVALRALAPALPAHAQLISLMIDVEDGEPEILEQCAIRSFGEELKDFREQAALTACCDLVIAIDSMMAHLAGALGRPLWIPLPTGADWRWMTGRDDSPWYPGARLFRQQSPGDWRSPLARIGAELRRFAAAFQT